MADLRVCFLGMCAAFLLVSLSLSPVFAATIGSSSGSAASSVVKVQLLEKDGSIETVPWSVDVRTVWAAAAGGFRVPRFQLLVHVPASEAIAPQLTADGVLLKKIGANDYLAEERGKAYVYPVIYRKSPAAPAKNVLLVLLAADDQISYLVDPDCAKAGLRFTVRESAPRLRFVALSCAQPLAGFKGDLQFQLVSSSGLKLDSAQAVAPASVSEQNASWRIPAPAAGWEHEQAIGPIVFVSAHDNRKVTVPLLFESPEYKSRKISFVVGLGASSYSYEQGTLRGQKISELALTPKGALSWNVIPKKVSLGLSGFMTAVPLSHSPKEFGAMRFFGLNTRVGYLLPSHLGGLDYEMFGGWYFWMMSVGNGVTPYGPSAAAGPEMVFSIAERHRARRGWSAYLKYAFLSERFLSTPKLSNRELAVGGAVQIAGPPEAPWTVTADLAQARFDMSSDWMRLFSLSLGVSRGF